MIIATSFSTYIEEAKEEVVKALELAKQDGFSAMGVVASEPLEYYLSKKEAMLLSGLRFSVHAPIVDLNIASTNEGIRKESIRQIKDSIILAKELSAKVVTIHPGKFRNTLLIQEAYMLLDLSLSELMPFAEEHNVILCLENMEPGHKELCVTLNQVQKVLERHPKLGLTLDLAHVAMVVSSEEEFYEYYLSLKSRVTHFHISGIRPKMSHVEVSLNESDVDFTKMIQLIKDFTGIVRIENRERRKNVESLNFIKNIIK
jgi:sugar phosphate isomerase/epimerase